MNDFLLNLNASYMDLLGFGCLSLITVLFLSPYFSKYASQKINYTLGLCIFVLFFTVFFQWKIRSAVAKYSEQKLENFKIENISDVYAKNVNIPNKDKTPVKYNEWSFVGKLDCKEKTFKNCIDDFKD